MGPLRALPWALLLAHIAFAGATYATLPSEFPAQFDLGGNVTRMASRSVWEWFALPLVSASTFGLLAWIRAQLPRRPQWFNFPGKDEFLALPATYQPPVIVEMQRVMDVTGALTVGLMQFIHVMMWRTALDPSGAGNQAALIVLPALAIGPVILLQTLRVQTAVDEARKRWRADGSPSA
jgi:uncharacterized membrane protein